MKLSSIVVVARLSRINTELNDWDGKREIERRNEQRSSLASSPLIRLQMVRMGTAQLLALFIHLFSSSSSSSQAGLCQDFVGREPSECCSDFLDFVIAGATWPTLRHSCFSASNRPTLFRLLRERPFAGHLQGHSTDGLSTMDLGHRMTERAGQKIGAG